MERFEIKMEVTLDHVLEHLDFENDLTPHEQDMAMAAMNMPIVVGVYVEANDHENYMVEAATVELFRSCAGLFCEKITNALNFFNACEKVAKWWVDEKAHELINLELANIHADRMEMHDER